MKLRTISLLIFLAATTVPAFANDTIFASEFEPVWVAGYHVGYQKAMYPTAVIDYAALSHINIGAIVPNADGTLDTTFSIDTTSGPIWAKAVATAAHAANRKTILMIGGAGANNWQGAASSTHLATFVSKLIGQMDSLGGDGLDLDWEPLNTSDYTMFTNLVAALRTARPGMIITMPVGWTNSNFQTSDSFYGTIAKQLDQINIMSYDMEWPAGGWKSWFTSALHGESGTTPSSIDSSVDFYLASGVPRSKLGIGIGFYGVCWHGVTGPRQVIGSGAGITGSDNTFSYSTIVTQYNTPANAANYHYDSTSEMPWLGSATAFGPNSCNFLSYENPQSVAAKGAYANRNGLGGTIIWTIGQGYISTASAGQQNALLDAVNTAFHPTN